MTIIPIAWDDPNDRASDGKIKYLIGFQVDLEKQPGAILRMMGDGSYAVNYSTSADPTPPMSEKLKAILGFNNPPDSSDPNTGANANAALNAPTNAPNPTSTANDSDGSKARFNNFILEESDDFIHVVSLKGFFQYISPSITPLLEYTPAELLGKSISDIAHPSDIVPIMRELKESTAQVQAPSTVTNATSLAQHYLSQAKLVHLLYRVRRKDSGYVWLESTGRLHVETSKGRKSIVFSGRIRRTPNLPWSLVVNEPGGLPSGRDGDEDVWAQVCVDNGLMLYVSDLPAAGGAGGATGRVLGRPASEVQGTPLKDWVASGWKVAVDAALTEARTKLEEYAPGPDTSGSALTSITCMRAVPATGSNSTASEGSSAPMITITFYSPDHTRRESSTPVPAASPMNASPPGGASPHGSSQARTPPTAPMGGSSSNHRSPPIPTPIPTPTSSSSSIPLVVDKQRIRRGVRYPSVICHIRFPPASSIAVPDPSSSTSQDGNGGRMNVQEYLRHLGAADGVCLPPPSSSRSDSSPTPGKSAPPRLVSASLTSNIFEELQTTRGTSWQYELQQLRMANAKLQGEIDEAVKMKRKASASGLSGGGGADKRSKK